MRLVLDTNVIISGLFWFGNERRLLNAARDQIISIYTCEELLLELEEVLSRPKFGVRLQQLGFSHQQLVEDYAALARPVAIRSPIKKVSRDIDDDIVIACAIAGDCEVIVSGDSDLLAVEEFHNIRILRVMDCLTELGLS